MRFTEIRLEEGEGERARQMEEGDKFVLLVGIFSFTIARLAKLKKDKQTAEWKRCG